MIIIGRITRPFGMDGEVMVAPMTDFPERFCELERVAIGDDDAPAKIWDVESARLVRGGVILKLKGMETAGAVQSLRGQYLFIGQEEMRPLPPDCHYIFRIIGLRVVKEDGSLVGRVVDVLTLPANDVYVIEDGTREILIPATKEIVRVIDMDKGLIVIHPLPGLLES